MANSDDRDWMIEFPVSVTSAAPIVKYNRAYQAYRATALLPYDRITLENSPSNVAAADHPFDHLISAEAVVSAESKAKVVPANA